MIYITGDTHGTTDIKKLEKDSYIHAGDYLIIAGDAAICWQGGEKDAAQMKFWSSKPYTVLFCDGNHENFDLLGSYPEEDWNGGRIHRIAPNIIHLIRGYIYTIEEKTFFVFGGGVSIDKAYRTPYVSWWPQEEPSFEECQRGLENLDKAGWKVDYVLTHAAPESIVRTRFNEAVHLMNVDCTCEKYLDSICDKLDFELWICGHYHFDHLFRKEKILEMYQDVVRLSPGYPIVNTNRV